MRAPLQPAVAVEARFEARQERMALAGEHHVERARQAHAHRPSGLPRAQRGDGGPRIGLHLLAAERAAHAQAFHRDLWRGMPSTRATISCVSLGCCVEECSDDAARFVEPGDGAWVSR